MYGSIFQNFLKFGSKFKKILERLGIFAQYMAQNWADWYMNGSLLLGKLVSVWFYFQILWWYIPTKTKLEYTPPPPACTISCQTPVCYHSVIQAVLSHCWRKICNSNKEHLIFPYVFITELLQRSYDPLDATVYNVWIVLLQSQVVSALMLFLLLDLSAEISNRHKQRTFY